MTSARDILTRFIDEVAVSLPNFIAPRSSKRNIPKFPEDPGARERVLGTPPASAAPPVAVQQKPTKQVARIGLGPKAGERGHLVPHGKTDPSARKPYTAGELAKGADINPKGSVDRDSTLKQANANRAKAHEYLKAYKDAQESGHREKAAYLKKQYNRYWQLWRDQEGSLKG